jgi:5-dehydro-2-deoxygluconokinase
MTNLAPDAVILGRIGYDLCAEQQHTSLSRATRFSSYLGGSSANMAVGLSRLGLRTGIVSCLGDDGISRFLIDYLAGEKVDTSHIQIAPGYRPSLALTEISPPDRFPQVFYRHEAVDTKLRITPEALDYVATAPMFITNGTSLCAPPSRESTYRALERARDAGRRVVFDIDYRAMSWQSPEDAGLAVRLALPFVDVLIGNPLELEVVTGETDAGRAAARLSRVPMLVSKLGDKGTRVYHGGESHFLAPYKVEVTSTIGAGDGFASGFLYALARGLPVLDCLHYGNAAAAIVVSRLSCAEAMPTLAELEQMIQAARR